MGIFDSFKKTVADLPISDIYKTRIDLALDQLADSERQIAVLQTENGKLQAQLQMAESERSKTQRELQKLQDEHAEEIQIHQLVEFRRGKRTAGKWQAFCPKCHMPLVDQQNARRVHMACCTAMCGWGPAELPSDLRSVIDEFSRAN